LLAQRISAALCHEEIRNSYLTSQIKMMAKQHDAFREMAETSSDVSNDPAVTIAAIFETSSLARSLQQVQYARSPCR